MFADPTPVASAQPPLQTRTVQEWRPGQGLSSRTRPLASEVPVAVAYNGITHAVVMATPANLLDFALGFTVSEGIALPDQVGRGELSQTDQGFVVRLSLPASAAEWLRQRQRSLASVTACGLCGVREIGETVRPLPVVPVGTPLRLQDIHQALETLRAGQHLNQATGAVHAAAWLPVGASAATHIREDVGRHSALDKLIGSRLRDGERLDSGAILMTSRCSLELVQKAATVGARVLVCVSAPTALATDQAQRAGLALVALARTDSMLVMTDPQGALHG